MKHNFGRCGLLAIPLLMLGCNNPGSQTSTNSRQIGEICDNVNGCQDGLYCEDGLCRKLCKSYKDCPDDTYTCMDGKCSKKSNRDEHGTDEHGTDEHGTDEHGTDEHGTDEHGTDEHGTDNERASVIPPDGYGLSPVVGRTSGSRYKIRVLGGSLSGSSQNSNSKLIVNEGVWHER